MIMFLTKKKLLRIIKEQTPRQIHCDECGLVFSAGHFLESHQEATGHKQVTIQDLVNKGVADIFARAASMPRKMYFTSTLPKEMGGDTDG